MENEYKLHIGSYGWRYNSWENSFYPEDLPVEWQLAYYANEYSVIMIPWELFQNNFKLLEQGIEDSEETCQIIFECPIQNINTRSNDEIHDDVVAILNKISSFESRIMGIIFVIPYSEISDISSEKLQVIKELLETSQEKMNICIDIQEPENYESLSEEFKSILNQTKTNLCYYNETTSNDTECIKSKFHVTFCTVTESNPKQMRNIIENSLIGECEGSTNVLIFRAESPSHEQMNTASVISDLL